MRIEEILTDGILKLLRAHPNEFYLPMEVVEVISALERACQYLYSGDRRKLLASHRRAGFQVSGLPHIPSTSVNFRRNPPAVNKEKFEITYLTGFNTNGLLASKMRKFYDFNVDAVDILFAINSWIEVLKVYIIKQ